MIYFSAIGQDSHRFENDTSLKKLILGGIHIDGYPKLDGNSDADVVLHAITNAISGLSGIRILGTAADRLCLEQGITDSSVYLAKALQTLESIKLLHCSITIEAFRPKLSNHIDSMRHRISELLGLAFNHVTITATTGEGLTSFGKGEGIQAFVIVSACQPVS